MFNPEDHQAYSRLGVAYAGIGMDHQARENGLKGLEISKQKNNAVYMPFTLYDLVQTYTLTGDLVSARKVLDELIGRKSHLSPELLKLDPDLKELFIESE